MRRLLVIVIGVFLLVGLWPRGVYAQGNELLKAGEIIESDYIRAGNTVQIDGEIKGDAFLAGGIVTVNGKIDGDLFVAAGKVSINGPVGNSIRVLAGDVTVNGLVGRNILLVCGNCSVTSSAVVEGSLLTAGGNLEVSAPRIGRGFRFFGNRLFLNSEVANEAFVVADREFLLGPRASISGSLKYTGSTEAVLEPGATVAGNISYQKQIQDESYPRFFGAKTILESYKKVQPLTQFLGFVVSALIGFVLLGLFPRGFEKVVSAIENRPYASLGWGAIAAVAVPVVAVLFTITVVGIPVAVVLV
ncbi:polymer-forming cytoskeletal protein, partial [Candidatus Microgenomates bacterium]|nr:polymer-forming cytoskeletal protein [Candidatus Microgenomates bacterium]